MNSSSKQKIKETQALNATLGHMDLVDTFRTFHPNAKEYTLLSNADRTFSRIVHISGHKLILSKFKKMEITSSIFSHHKNMRLDINYKETKNNCKTHIHGN